MPGRLSAPVVPDFSAPLDPMNPADFAVMIERTKAESRRNCQPEVWALINAGWTFEIHDLSTSDPEPWQWRWRRPGKRPERPGRLFASTGQAYNALMREQL